jgi:hypothetical protein
MPRQPQPVPPIFQPEIAAEAIQYAAHHRRRQIYVAWPAVKAIFGNKVAPGVLDAILARDGYREQQTDQPAQAGRPDNLFEPVDSDHGAHGPFDERSLDRSWLLWANLRREWLGLAAGAALVGAALGIGRD